MFGYVVIDKPNILIKDYQTYRSYYCGLCKTMGKVSGQKMRLTLNYDIVLLALLGHNYEDREPEFKEGHCIVHPVGKKIAYVARNPILERIADINTILGYYKVYDDVIDEHKHRVIKEMITPNYKRAKKRLPAFDTAVGKWYEKLREKEKEGATVEKLAEINGMMLSSCGDALTDKCDSDLREMLFHVGRWVYVIDAFDDIKRDREKGNFNPFLREDKGTEDIMDEAERKARGLLYDCIDHIIGKYNAMKIDISEGPLSNIVYKGLAERTEFILKRRGEKWQKTRL